MKPGCRTEQSLRQAHSFDKPRPKAVWKKDKPADRRLATANSAGDKPFKARAS